MMKAFRFLMVVAATLALVGCGPEKPKKHNDGFTVTVSTNEIIANGKKAAKFVATYNGDLLHEEMLQITVDEAPATLPDMKFRTSEVGSHTITIAYGDNPAATFSIRGIEPASTLGIGVLILFYLLSPALVLWACNKWKVLNKIGPVLLLYILGIIAANLNLIPEGCKGIQDTISTIAIPLALPMMLYSCNFQKFSVKTSLKITIIGVVAVVLAVVGGFYLLKDGMGSEAQVVAGAIAGKCTGGTPNLAALKVMLGMENSTFLILNSFDMVICFVYLVMLMTVGIKWARKVLGRGIYQVDKEVDMSEYAEQNPYKDFGKKKSIKQLIKVTLLTLVIVAASFGVATLAKRYDEHIFTVVMILTLTTLALLFSLWKEVKTWDKSYDAGMYLIYIFSIVVASMANFRTLDYDGVLYLVLFQIVVVFGSFLLTILGAKLFKVDGDTAVITSNTLINSPIFVPMIAASMKNRDIVVVGVTIGLVGYALGNYLGFIVFKLLGGVL